MYWLKKEFCFPISVLASSKKSTSKVHTICRDIKYIDYNLQTPMVKSRKKVMCKNMCVIVHTKHACYNLTER